MDLGGGFSNPTRKKSQTYALRVAKYFRIGITPLLRISETNFAWTLSEMFRLRANSENWPGRVWGTHIEKQKRQVVVARGGHVQVNNFPLTANALAVSQLTGILAVQARDTAV
jgi:hypothetical protein